MFISTPVSNSTPICRYSGLWFHYKHLYCTCEFNYHWTIHPHQNQMNKDTKMPELSKGNGVEWSRQLERLTVLADEVKNASSSALDLFLTREDSDDWLMIDRSMLIATIVRDSMQSACLKLTDPRK